MSGSLCAVIMNTRALIELNECIVAFQFLRYFTLILRRPGHGIITHTMKDEVHTLETSRRELLDQSPFSSVDDVRGAMVVDVEYNEERP